MVTDPVQRVRERSSETPLTLNVRAALSQLAELPPSVEAPYLTLTLDWRPDGSDPAKRPGLQWFEQDAESICQRYWPRGVAYDSAQADLERIRTYLNDELDPSAQGAIIVACNAIGVFQPFALGLPVATNLQVGPTPALVSLARVEEDFATYAVLLADQQSATLSFITQANTEQSIEVESNDYPRKQAQGGWSQRRFQSRADERVNAFARTVAEETQRALDEEGVDMLILAGDEVITSALDEAFHETVKEKLIGTIRLDVRATEAEIVEATAPLAKQAEREREAAAVEAVHEAVGVGTGAAGPEDVLTAVQAGQVMHLVMADDFNSPGWADFTLPIYGIGEPPKDHPAGGDAAKIVPVPLEAELVRLAIQTDAEIEIVKTDVPVSAGEQSDIPEAGQRQPRTDAALRLDEFGGVGAVLRFALDTDQPTPDL